MNSPARADIAAAQPYEEIGQHLRAAQQIAPLSDSGFGDQISLYDGATSFAATDISIPGNNALPVQLARRFNIENRPWYQGHLGGFGDWDLDVPHVEAVVTAELGWILNGANPNARCSDNTDVPDTHVTETSPGSAPLSMVYDGTKLHIPGAGDQ
ncbi:MAG TPA: hypothetical protein VFK08_08120, partial [Rhodanobacteraceae bacterium]|nr:hypothetical protein [Rhodanobacteraceae bacterium]